METVMAKKLVLGVANGLFVELSNSFEMFEAFSNSFFIALATLFFSKCCWKFDKTTKYKIHVAVFALLATPFATPFSDRIDSWSLYQSSKQSLVAYIMTLFLRKWQLFTEEILAIFITFFCYGEIYFMLKWKSFEWKSIFHTNFHTKCINCNCTLYTRVYRPCAVRLLK